VEKNEVRVETWLAEDADIIVTAYGSTARICRNAIRAARADGIKVGMVRPITLWPFPSAAYAEAAAHAKGFLDVEMSMGQMIDDVRLAIGCSRPVRFFGRTGGVVPTPAEIRAEIDALCKEVL
jgi:2-oxoglutarate ferredoxin oxidoreductase subunit alpha